VVFHYFERFLAEYESRFESGRDIYSLMMRGKSVPECSSSQAEKHFLVNFAF